jgi:hypothetical protein
MGWRTLMPILLAMAVTAGGLYAWHVRSGAPAGSGRAPSVSFAGFAAGDGAPSVVPTVPVPPLGKTYANDAYGFSFSYPDGYAVQDAATDDATGARTILVQDAKGSGVQILISPFDDADQTIDEARIRADIPDLAVREPQPVQVGADGSASTGLAFKSDNAAFNGDSREVWFAFRGNLYQISTYAGYDDFLKALLSTWHFN